MFTETNAEVVIDFTQVDAARENVQWLAEHGIHAVVGTTGFSDDDYVILPFVVHQEQLRHRPELRHRRRA